MVFQVFERQPVKPRRNDRVLLACGFAFTTGWVDVLCTMRFGAFGTMMTGNSIFVAKSIVSGSFADLLFYTSVVVCYCIGVVLHRVLDHALGERTSALAAAIPVATCCVLVDVCHAALGPSRYYVCFVSVACGCVNVVSQKIAGVVTNAVTGNLQKLSSACWEHVMYKPLGPGCRRHVFITAVVHVSFLSGIGLSAVSLNLVGDTHLNFIPPAFAFTLLLWGHDCAYAHELEVRRQENREAARKHFGVISNSLKAMLAPGAIHVSDVASALSEPSENSYHPLPAPKEGV